MAAEVMLVGRQTGCGDSNRPSASTFCPIVDAGQMCWCDVGLTLEAAGRRSSRSKCMCYNLLSVFFSGAERRVGRAQLASDVRRIENSGCVAVSKRTGSQAATLHVGAEFTVASMVKSRGLFNLCVRSMFKQIRQTLGGEVFATSREDRGSESMGQCDLKLDHTQHSGEVFSRK